MSRKIIAIGGMMVGFIIGFGVALAIGVFESIRSYNAEGGAFRFQNQPFDGHPVPPAGPPPGGMPPQGSVNRAYASHDESRAGFASAADHTIVGARAQAPIHNLDPGQSAFAPNDIMHWQQAQPSQSNFPEPQSGYQPQPSASAASHIHQSAPAPSVAAPGLASAPHPTAADLAGYPHSAAPAAHTYVPPQTPPYQQPPSQQWSTATYPHAVENPALRPPEQMPHLARPWVAQAPQMAHPSMQQLSSQPLGYAAPANMAPVAAPYPAAPTQAPAYQLAHPHQGDYQWAHQSVQQPLPQFGHGFQQPQTTPPHLTEVKPQPVPEANPVRADSEQATDRIRKDIEALRSRIGRYETERRRSS